MVKLVDPLGGVAVGEADGAGRQTSPDRKTPGRAWRPAGPYDRTGRFRHQSWDGVVHHRVVRDFTADHDHHRDQQELARSQQCAGTRAVSLVEAGPGNRAVSWGYDADGRRAWMRTRQPVCPLRVRPAGRLTQVTSSAFGRVVWYSPSADGRRDRRRYTVRWEHADGFVTGHLVRQGGVVSHTAVSRDKTGRVAWTSRDGPTAYTYDGANHSSPPPPPATAALPHFTWGQAQSRLAAETHPDGATRQAAPGARRPAHRKWDTPPAGRLFGKTTPAGMVMAG